MSQAMQTRPSELVGLFDPLVKFYFDRAVWSFGSLVDSEMERASEKSKTTKSATAKRMMVLNKYIAGDTRGRFKDPAMGF